MLAVYTYQEFCDLLEVKGNVYNYVLAFPKVERINEGYFEITDIMLYLRDIINNNQNYQINILKQLIYESYLNKIKGCLFGYVKEGVKI